MKEVFETCFLLRLLEIDFFFCMKYIIGILVIAAGVFLVIKTEWMVENFGTSAWAEEHFGMNGGTRLMYKVIGLIMVFGTLMVWTGAFGRIFLGIFGRLFGVV